MRRWKEGAPQAAPGRVLVRFKQTPAGARLGAALARRPLPGLQLERLVGKHHTLQVPPPGSGSTSGGATISTAGTTTSGSSPSLPSDALMLFSVTDGSSVEAKVAQLRANPGGAGSLQAWWKPGASSTVQRCPCPPSSNCCRCLPAWLSCLLISCCISGSQPAGARRQWNPFVRCVAPVELTQVWRQQSLTMSATLLQASRLCQMTACTVLQPATRACGTSAELRPRRPGIPPPVPGRWAGQRGAGGPALARKPTS